MLQARQKAVTEAAHIGDRGLGKKCSDLETAPLCVDHHRIGPQAHHIMGKLFWPFHRLNRDTVVRNLNEQYPKTP